AHLDHVMAIRDPAVCLAHPRLHHVLVKEFATAHVTPKAGHFVSAIPKELQPLRSSGRTPLSKGTHPDRQRVPRSRPRVCPQPGRRPCHRTPPPSPAAHRSPAWTLPPGSGPLRRTRSPPHGRPRPLRGSAAS